MTVIISDMLATRQTDGRAEEIKHILRTLNKDEKKADELFLKHQSSGEFEIEYSKLRVMNTIGNLVASKRISKASRVAEFFGKWGIIGNDDVAPYKDMAINGLVRSVELEGGCADGRLKDFGMTKDDVEHCKSKAEERVRTLLENGRLIDICRATIMTEYFGLNLERAEFGEASIQKAVEAVRTLVKGENTLFALRIFSAFKLKRSDVEPFMQEMITGIAEVATKHGHVVGSLCAAKLVGLSEEESEQVRQLVKDGLEGMVENEGNPNTGWVEALLTAAKVYGLKSEAELLGPNVMKKLSWIVYLGLIDVVMEVEEYLGLQKNSVRLEVIDGVAVLLNKRDEDARYDAYMACRKYGLAADYDTDAIVTALMSKGDWSEASARQAAAYAFVRTSEKTSIFVRAPEKQDQVDVEVSAEELHGPAKAGTVGKVP